MIFLPKLVNAETIRKADADGLGSPFEEADPSIERSRYRKITQTVCRAGAPITAQAPSGGGSDHHLCGRTRSFTSDSGARPAALFIADGEDPGLEPAGRLLVWVATRAARPVVLEVRGGAGREALRPPAARGG